MKPPPAAAMRRASIDSLRVAAMFAVVALHAALSYAVIRPPDLAWLVYDRPDARFDRVCLLVQCFAMPAFFMISGFSAAALSRSLDVRAFLRHRARRLLLPFVAGLLVILPVCYYLWGTGWFLSGKCEIYEILTGRFGAGEAGANVAGPAHLWFLEYLLVYTGLFAAARVFYRRRPGWKKLWASEGAVRIFEAWWRPFFFAVPTAAVLWLGPQAVLHFRNSFVPEWARFTHYAVFFASGVWLSAFEDKWEELAGAAPACLFFSIPAYALAEIFLKKYLSGPLAPVERVSMALWTAVFMWLFLFGLFGLFSRPGKEGRFVAYWSRASYWVYLVHFPWVAWAQIALLGWDGPAPAKFAAAFFAGIAGSVFTYRIFMPAIRTVFAENPRAAGRPLLGAKLRLTTAFLTILLALGAAHQLLYKTEYARTVREVTGFYRIYLGREPDPEGLNYWTTMAMTRYGLKRVEREGFVEAKAKGAK